MIRGLFVHHKDGNPFNNDPANLQVVTRGAHSRIHGRRGDYHKITPTEARKGLPSYSDDALLAEIRRVDGVSQRRRTKLCKFRDFDVHSITGHGTIIRRFGTWTEAKRLAGVT